MPSRTFPQPSLLLVQVGRQLVSAHPSVRTTNYRGCTCFPKLEHDLEAELYLARRACRYKRPGVSTELGIAGGFEAIQLKGPRQHVHSCPVIKGDDWIDAGVEPGSRIGILTREIVPHLVEVRPVEDVHPIRDQIDLHAAIPEDKHGFLDPQVHAVKSIPSGGVAAGGKRRRKVAVSARREIVQIR